jgi:putative ABC transport system permease protein
MSLRKSSSIALRSLLRNRLQSLLTILSLTIGVATVLAMVAVGSGAEHSISSQVRAAGMNIVLVRSGNHRAQRSWDYGQGEEPPDSPIDNSAMQVMDDPEINNPATQLMEDPEMLAGLGDATTLSLDDAASIRSMGKVQAVSAGVHDSVYVSSSSSNWVPMVRGEQASLPQIRRAWVFPYGRFFTAAEEAQNAPVAVLGSIAATGLFGARNPVGESIMIHGESFRVIGVIASGTWMVAATSGDGQFDAIYIPVGNAQRLFNRPYLDNITVSAGSTGDVSRLEKEIGAWLRERHHLRSRTMPSDFTVMSQGDQALAQGSRGNWSRVVTSNTPQLDHVTLAQLAKTLQKTGRTMTWLLTAIAAVSLVVGGIGIMNIMLLSVTERTREIGIRREVGARALEIRQQFLLEATMLSVFGGLLGIALGVVASAAIANLVHWSTNLSWIAIAISFSLSAMIGILFGYYPAQQAARVTPLTALRYES